MQAVNKEYLGRFVWADRSDVGNTTGYMNVSDCTEVAGIHSIKYERAVERKYLIA